MLETEIDDEHELEPASASSPTRIYQRCASCAEPWRGEYDATWRPSPRGPLHCTRVCREMSLEGVAYAPGRLRDTAPTTHHSTNPMTARTP